MARALAQVTCPSCQQLFSAPVEQVLDVDLDPSAKPRLVSGQVNLIGCPHCGMAGGIKVPFIYHDAAKELALVFMPMEVGRSEAERQKIIGSLSRVVMDQMPTDQRKGYLLNPQVFITVENLSNRIFDADGITPEMVEAQKARADLLKRLVEAATPEDRTRLIQENEAEFDEAFFRILMANLEQMSEMGLEKIVEDTLAVRAMLFEQTELGRRLQAQAEVLEAFGKEPTREKLVALLVETEDEATRAALVAMGQALVDYFFFQQITERIEAAATKAERQRIESVRQQVLDIRDDMQRRAEDIMRSRVTLVQTLLVSDQPELVARRHIAEIDELFFNVLATEIEAVQREGQTALASDLEKIWEMIMKLIEERMPPVMLVLTALLQAKSDQEVQQILERNRPLVNEPFVQILENVIEQTSQGEEQGEAQSRLVTALEMARAMVMPKE